MDIRMDSSHLQNRKSFSTDTAYSVISLNAYYMLISSSISPNFASGSTRIIIVLRTAAEDPRSLQYSAFVLSCNSGPACGGRLQLVSVSTTHLPACNLC